MKHEYTLFKRYKDTKNKKDIVWFFYYYDENNKRCAKSTGKSKKYEAEQIAKAFVESDDKSKLTLQQYTEKFFIWGECPWIIRQHAKGKEFSQSVANSRRSHLVNYILPKFGKRLLNTLNRVEIENWLVELKHKTTGKPLSNQTKNHILYTFRIVLREAEREQVVNYNCLATVESLANLGQTRDVFTKEELQLLFPDDVQQMIVIWGRKEYAYLFYLLATTGLRSGEIRALQWKHVIWNEKRNGLRIERAVKDNNEFGTTKTGHSRVVLLTNRADYYLQDWLEETPFDQMNDLIFFGADKIKTVTRKTLSSHFDKALERVKIETKNRCLVIHSFRHTYNTLLKPLLPKQVLQSMTGHRTDSMTERYNHPNFEDEYDQIVKYETVLDSLI